MEIQPPSPQTLKRHGITENQWRELWRRQGGLCAVCGKPPRTKLVIDHDHRAARFGKPAVRGLVDPMCNRRIGQVLDNADWCRRAADYLDRGADPELGLYPKAPRRRRRTGQSPPKSP